MMKFILLHLLRSGVGTSRHFAAASDLVAFGSEADITLRSLRSLQQTAPGVILENLCVANVAPQRVHALVARLIGHLENRGAASCGASQKPRAQRVSGKPRRIEAERAAC
jgi:hypothetical protein